MKPVESEQVWKRKTTKVASPDKNLLLAQSFIADSGPPPQTSRPLDSVKHYVY